MCTVSFANIGNDTNAIVPLFTFKQTMAEFCVVSINYVLDCDFFPIYLNGLRYTVVP